MRIGILGAARIAPAALIKPAKDNAEVVVAAVAARDVPRSVDQLTELDGIGDKTAEKLKNTAAETMEELNKALEELLKKELQEVVAGKPLFDEAIFGPDKKEKKEEPPLTEADVFKDVGEKGKKEEEASAAVGAGEPAGEETEEALDEDIAGEAGEESGG